MAEFEVDGVIYEFPDSYTNEQVKGILRRKGIIPTPALELPKAPGAEVAPVGALGRDPLARAAARLCPTLAE